MKQRKEGWLDGKMVIATDDLWVSMRDRLSEIRWDPQLDQGSGSRLDRWLDWQMIQL